jgi:catechol 2,3-dioxygenase-like lactoylglutathione lyase family enzyme
MGLDEIRNLDYTVLLCERLAETTAFYREVMGFQVEVELDNWVSFRIGAAILALRPRGPAPAWDDGPAVTGSAAVQLAFRVPPSALDACYAELVANEVPILREPTDLPAWRHRAFFFRDPEDNVIEIYAEV